MARLGPWPLTGEQRGALLRSILQHYYRLGEFELANGLAREAGLEGAEEGGRVFAELHSLLRALRDHDTGRLLAWCGQQNHEPLLGRLAFQLCSIEFMNRVLEGEAKAAVGYAREAFPAYASGFERDVALLMGCLPYGHRLLQSPYADLHPRYLWEDVESSLIDCYCQLRHLPRRSSLEQA